MAITRKPSEINNLAFFDLTEPKTNRTKSNIAEQIGDNICQHIQKQDAVDSRWLQLEEQKFKFDIEMRNTEEKRKESSNNIDLERILLDREKFEFEKPERMEIMRV